MKIRRDFICDPGLVLYLPLYALDGSAFKSKDAYGHSGTVTGASWRPDGRYFDGNDDWISIALHDALITPTQGVIVVWFKHTVDDNLRQLLGFTDKDTTSLDGFHLRTHTNKNIYWRTEIGGSVTQNLRTDDNVYIVGNWACAVIASNGTAIEIDVDGINRSLTIVAGTNNGDWMGDGSNLDTLALGSLRRTPAQEYGNYEIGEVLIYNAYKSFTERNRIYLATKWRYQ